MHPLTPSWYNSRNDLKKIDNITKVIGTGIDNIKVIENWISQKDINRALSIINEYPVKEDVTHSYPIHTIDGHKLSLEYIKFAREFSSKIINYCEKLYNQPLVKDQPFLYIVHPKGTYIDPHTDILDITDPNYENDSFDSQIEKFPYLWSGHLSALVYLNDDYDGGELYFPELNFSVKPKSGMLITFPGNLHYVHGVSKITKGVRYTLSQWSKFKNF